MSWFQEFATRYAAFGYPILFAGVLIESAGIPVPGETAVLTAAFLASPAGGGHLDLFLVMLTAALAAMLGDNLGYELGRRWARPRLAGGKSFLFLTPSVLHRAEGYFQRYGIWTVFFGRFIAALRVAAALAAGTAGMPWLRFFLANAAGAVTWSVAISLLGYFFGYSFDKLHHWIGRATFILLICVVLFVGLRYLLRHLPKGAVEAAGITRADIVRAVMVLLLELACVALLVMLFRGYRQTAFDREVTEWIQAHPSAIVDAVAWVAVVIGSLPVVAVLTALLSFGFWRWKYPVREIVAPLLVLVIAEAVGWLMIEFFQHGPGHREAWSAGIGGLAPLRDVAVLGLAGNRLARHGIVFREPGLALVLMIWICLGVIWLEALTPTETLLESAAGALVASAVIRWLEREKVEATE